jgi:predicted RNase H-like nuclease (RuvC/YqgF family)
MQIKIEEILVGVVSALVTFFGFVLKERFWDRRYQEAVTKQVELEADKKSAEHRKLDVEAGAASIEALDMAGGAMGRMIMQIETLRGQMRDQQTQIAQTQADYLTEKNQSTIYRAEMEKRFMAMDGRIQALHRENEALKTQVRELVAENNELRARLNMPARVLKTI